MENTNNKEFFKLNEDDRKVLFHLMDENPKLITSWIHSIVEEYQQEKGITIDPEKLQSEIDEEETLTETEPIDDEP